MLYLGEVQLLAAPREPGIPELVVLDRERILAEGRIDVVAPHRARFVQVLIAVDDHGGRLARMWEPLDRVVPPESRGRRVVAWGVVAWTGVGIAGVLWLPVFVLGLIAGIFPYLALAALLAFALNPFVRLLVRHRVSRQIPATGPFAVF